MSNDSGSKVNGGLTKIFQWKPADIIDEPYKVGNGHVCLVLNREVRIPEHVVTELWQKGKSIYVFVQILVTPINIYFFFN